MDVPAYFTFLCPLWSCFSRTFLIFQLPHQPSFLIFLLYLFSFVHCILFSVLQVISYFFISLPFLLHEFLPYNIFFSVVSPTLFHRLFYLLSFLHNGFRHSSSQQVKRGALTDIKYELLSFDVVKYLDHIIWDYRKF
jgi:hypothetical protein